MQDDPLNDCDPIAVAMHAIDIALNHSVLGYNPRHVPMIPTKVEWIFGFGLADGIFVRVEDYIVCGAYRDGMPLQFCTSIPYEYDYPDQY